MTPIRSWSFLCRFLACSVAMQRAGTPATIASCGTSRVTTAPAPTMASRRSSPRTESRRRCRSTRRAGRVGTTVQSASVCSGRRRRPWMAIVDEHHAVSDEHLVFDGHAFADEGVRRNLATAADHGVLLNLDERADLQQVMEVDRSLLAIGKLGCQRGWSGPVFRRCRPRAARSYSGRRRPRCDRRSRAASGQR